MKQGRIMNGIIILVLFAAVATYFGVYVYQSTQNKLRTMTAINYTVDESSTASGFIVREEFPIACDFDLIEVLPGEGERIGIGQTVAVIYKDEEALKRKTQIKELKNRIEQLKYAAKYNSVVADAKELDKSISIKIYEISAAVSKNELLGTKDKALELKNLLYRRDNAFGGENSAESELQTYQSLLDELSGESAQDTVEIKAEMSGTFSGVVDGFEKMLTLDKLNSITPSEFKEILSMKASPEDGMIGKLIPGYKWYFVTEISEKEKDNYRVGSTVKLRFSRDFSADLNMEVERVSAPENGRCVAVFSSDKAMAETTLLRFQTVEIIFKSHSGVRVPKMAVRLDDNGGPGVYCYAGLAAKFKKIDILYETEDYYISRMNPAETSLLRAGDVMIIGGKDLYDGKVLA